MRRWEAGGGPLPFRNLRLIAAKLDIPLTDLMGLTDGGRRSEWLVLVPGGTRLEADNAMLGREFLRYVAALAGASVTDHQRLVAALTDLGRVDHRLVADLEFLTAQYAGAMWTTPPGRLLPTLYGHLAILRRLMVGPVGEARQGLLQVQAAETAIVVGRLEWALERRDDAAQHWQLGARLASQAGDAALVAHATAMRAWSYSSVHGVAQDRDVPAALALLDNAIGFAPHTACYLLAWTLAERAHEHATDGDAYASDCDLDAAARALAGHGAHLRATSARGAAGTRSWVWGAAILARRPAPCVRSPVMSSHPADPVDEELGRVLADPGARAHFDAYLERERQGELGTWHPARGGRSPPRAPRGRRDGDERMEGSYGGTDAE